ncbi:hypothetical protein BI347_15240 [Chromobacterium sphagni]|uniref:Transmembrane protein n=2 Tax=Chromobacterium sphagni TaxID=1903179 RepID=A0A1S1X695_9NEIS|nr:hypothetical protein BI347_15240 [Chromobacterium sphagni]
MNLIKRMQSNRKLALIVLILSTLMFMALSALWRGGSAGSVWLSIACPALLLLALAGQLSALLALLQKPRK